MEFFLKYKTVLLRFAGALMIVIGFAIHFWTAPKEGVSEMEIAAANVARMEASVSGVGGSSKKTQSTQKYLEELKSTQEKQMRYLTIIAMVLGVGCLGFSFIKPKSDFLKKHSTS
ncbi:hypothetical protein KKG77_04000 [bacterium]|nr:hypothetical protein [bacterium]